MADGVDRTVITDHPYFSQVRLLIQAALLIFVYTVTIGILNGTDLVDFNHKTLLSHVHTGTLGWITTSVFAGALWLFGGTRKTGWRDSVMSWLPYATIVAVVVYNLAFLLTSGELRPGIGALMLIVIVIWLVWIFTSAKDVVMSVPRLGILAALVTATLGGLLGVLLGLGIARGEDILPGDGYASHPATMVIGFLIPVGMALSEWHLRPELLEQRATTLGRAQIALPFIGGLCVTVGLLAESEPLIAVSLPFEIIGVGILIARLRPGFGPAWSGQRSPALLASLTPLWIVANIAMFVFLIVKYAGDLGEAPVHYILAVDHMMFIGVMSNSLFALAASAATAVKTGSVRLLFWAMNVGLLGFAIGLIADVAILKRIFTPIMGAGILVGVAILTMSLSRPSTPKPAPARA